jgi:hypothetical protein
MLTMSSVHMAIVKLHLSRVFIGLLGVVSEFEILVGVRVSALTRLRQRSPAFHAETRASRSRVLA